MNVSFLVLQGEIPIYKKIISLSTQFEKITNTLRRGIYKYSKRKKIYDLNDRWVVPNEKRGIVKKKKYRIEEIKMLRKPATLVEKY